MNDLTINPKRSFCLVTTVGILSAACIAKAPGGDITIDSTTLTITGDDADPNRFNGAGFFAEVADGMARFRVYGDLVINGNDRIIGTGDRPISIIAGGNITIEDGAEIDVSAIAISPGPGGGAGAGASEGGAGGAGGRRGIIGDRTNGTDGGAGGGGGSGGSAPAGNGTSGGGGKYSLSGQPGADGADSPTAGSGTDGFQSPTSGGAGGSSGGTHGTGGSGGSAGGQQGGSGGGGGAGGIFSGDGGGSGGDATSTAIGHGFLGGSGIPGGRGSGGSHSGSGPALSGGGGGGAGKGGGGGGGGGGGRNGAGGGGGGGGGAALTVSGTSGGAGGNGGRGGAGGKGGNGGAGGPGGAGGGAFEIVALGRLDAGAATLLALGGAGDAGMAGLSGVDPGANGEGGKSGGNVANGNQKGGDGGDGTDGGNGADGRPGGSGGSGGGGGGGGIRLAGSVLHLHGAIEINVSGGPGGTPGVNDGSGGRVLLAGNNPVGFSGTATGAVPEFYDGPRATNPHVFLGTVATPYIPNLSGGAAVVGVCKNLNAGSFPAVVAGAPANGRVALLRLDSGPPGYADDYSDHDMLLFINLTNEVLSLPRMGVGEAGTMAPLQKDGPGYSLDFGGSGPVAMQSFPPYCVYATWVPDTVEWFNIGFEPEPGVTASESQQSLETDGILYLAYGGAISSDRIPPTGPVLFGNEDPISLINTTLGFGNRVEFEILGTGSDTWEIETCRDLVSWKPDGSATLRHGWAHYTSVAADFIGPRFFRGVRQPGGPVRWASSVLEFSSEFTTTDWSASQAVGEPDSYPVYDDISTSWASETTDDQVEFLELGYENPAPIRSISIYETFNPGAVETISVWNPGTGLWEVVWSGTAAAAPPVSRIFTVNFPLTPFPVSAIRIDVNSPAVPGWNEIDAVSIQ